MLNNKLYDILKWLVMIVLPAIATLYGTLAHVWGFPDSDKVLTTLTAISVCLGTILGISTVKYNSGGSKQ